jgi:L,D-transpeptidase catalytic domain
VQSEKRTILYAVLVGSMVAGTLVFAPLAQAATGVHTKISAPHSVSVESNRMAGVAYSVKLEDQLLAILRYLPVSFEPSGSATIPTTTTTTTTLPNSTTTTSTLPASTTTTTTLPVATSTVSDPTKLQSGSYVWRFRTLPPAVKQQWRVGSNNVVLQGALMSFQLTHNLTTTGSMNSSTWHTLVSAAIRNQVDPSPYNYVYVRQTLPELLKLYVNGRVTYETYVNTGVSDAPTQTGTYPVYERFLTTTMSGVNPTARPTATPAFPGSRTSTAVMRCTVSSVLPTATRKAWAASRCRSRTRRFSFHTRPSVRSSRFSSASRERRALRQTC